ncbi:cutinase transcription factor 1 alpha [Ilyonectria sp. MPI-CAGE-AT-0026]|nr:cutinase transcription factor 1 alpha [Ilyonectria sp. MPI-CAGE-AT-0026]
MIHQRKRARQACLSCNSRRVKCDVTEHSPCTNCATAEIRCSVRESRRGKHPRPSRGSTSKDLTQNAGHQSPESIHVDTTHISGDSPPDEHVAASQVLAGLAQTEAIEVLQPPPPREAIEQNAPLPSQQEISEYIQPPRVSRQEDESSVFLGESTSMRYLHDNTPPHSGPSPPQNLRFLYSVPDAVRAENLIPQWEAERRRARLRALTAEGALSFPPQVAIEDLLKASFRWFHTCFAVVDEPDTWNRYREGTLSPLLLQAILFIAVIHCEEEDLPKVGLGTRHKAKYVFYNRAKDLYDADFEPNKLAVIQALFLMSFWRAGALLEKDSRHWLGAALSSAQTKALHRSSHSADSKLERVRKRIWWSIYVRERQCAAALGLPNRIRDEDCDVDPLLEQDFENAFDPLTPTSSVQECVSYMVGMVQLSRSLGRIVHCGFLPSKTLTSIEREQIKDELMSWRKTLPLNMQPSKDGFDQQLGFQSNMLHLAYNNLLILLYRTGCVGTRKDNDEVDGQLALQAAARNSRIIEDMLLEGNMCHAQIHVITNVFNTLCIHTVSLRESQGSRRSIAEYRAKLCLLGLQELQKTWEVRNWILQLFFQYLDRSIAARLQLHSDIGAENENAERTSFQRIQTAPGSPSQNVPLNDMDGIDTLLESDAPWSWSTQEASQFLYSQIENNFAFGEGGVLDWNAADAFGSTLPPLGNSTPSGMDI